MLHLLRRRTATAAHVARAHRQLAHASSNANDRRARRRSPREHDVEFARLERTTLPPRRSHARARAVPHALDDAVLRAREHNLTPRDVLRGAAARVCAEIRHKLAKNVYCVGGAARDATRYGSAADARDIDLVTDATYGEIKRAFGRRVRIVGRRFRVALVRDGDEVVELASFSATGAGAGAGAGGGETVSSDEDLDDDVDDADERSMRGGDSGDDTLPRTASGEIDFDAVLRRRRGSRAETEASTSWKASTKSVDDSDSDLMRLIACKENARARDFTVNALYYDPFRNEMLDFFGGAYDAVAGVVRCVNDTHASLREDPVRMLRAVRLAARHDGFTMTKELRAGLRAYAPTLKTASMMRVMQELRTLMQGGYAGTTMKLFWHSTLMKYIFPVQHAFLLTRLPTTKTLTYELDSTFTTSKRDVDGGCALLFDALEAYDADVKSRGAAERHKERPVAQWLSLLVAPIAMTRLREHETFAGARSTLPAPWRAGESAETNPELFAQWEAFTGAVATVLDEMLTASGADGHDGINPDAIDVLVKGDLASTLLMLLARGPMFAASDRRSDDEDAFRWHDARFDASVSSHGARVKAYAKTKRRDWHPYVCDAEDVDLVRACLAAAAAARPL